MKEHYLYKHIHPDTNEPFYVGVGTKEDAKNPYKRAYAKNNRTKGWKELAYNLDYKIEILLESENYETIKQKEIELISFYKRIDCCDGILVNLTDGGEGVVEAHSILTEDEIELVKSVGDKIRTRRLEINLSQENLSYDANIPRNQVGRIERGEISTSITTLLKICKALKIEIRDLF